VENITFEVGAPVGGPVYRDAYELVIEYMHGDADAFDAKEIIFNNDDSVKDLQIAVYVIERCFADNSGAMYDCDTPEQLAEALEIDAEVASRASDIGVFNYDLFTDGQSYASFDGYKVFYYDDRGVKHKVNVRGL